VQSETVPSNVLHNLLMGIPLAQRVQSGRQLVRLVDVPQTNLIIVAARQKKPQLVGVPVKAVALFGMTQQSQVGLNFVGGRLSSLLEIVKNVHFPTSCLRCNDFVRLWHLSGLIHFAHVVDLYFNLNALFLFFIGGALLLVGLCLVVKTCIELSGVFRTLQRNFAFEHLHVVLFVVARVRADQQALD